MILTPFSVTSLSTGSVRNDQYSQLSIKGRTISTETSSSSNQQKVILQQNDESLSIRNTTTIMNSVQLTYNIRMTLGEMIVSDELPFSFVENVGFRNYS